MRLTMTFVVAALSALAGTAAENDTSQANQKAARVHAETATPSWRIGLEKLHAWHPPFGLDRVGQSSVIAVESPDAALRSLSIAARLNGRELASRPLSFSDDSPKITRARFDDLFDYDEIIVTSRGATGAAPVELARKNVQLPAFEAAALAQPEEIINPVDLNAILVPGDWLLLGPKGSGRLTLRAIQRDEAEKKVLVRAWFESLSKDVVESEWRLSRGKRGESMLTLPGAAQAVHDVLHVSISDVNGIELWHEQITTMRTSAKLSLPSFGAIQTKLRYDAPISVRDPATGAFSSLPYADAWKPQLEDVVVALPSGARFVFWRGSSYIPFWATRNNVGMCCEWAEIIPPFPPDAVDCVEPLMDKELRFGRVEILESTSARVHVRWTYQSNDLHYNVWGDQAVEDYYFYPDGFGTRVLTLTRDPARNYELSEFILIAPQKTYPFSFVPSQPVDILFLDGERRVVTFPATQESLGMPRNVPAAYRVRAHRDDPASAIYFSPQERSLPRVFAAFRDQGQLVTPAYWGSHWPLARGNATGSAIDDRINSSPHHTSLMTWQDAKPTPISSRTGPSIDTLGRSKVMTTERWAWMIGMSGESDNEVLKKAKTFTAPPSLEIVGAHLHPDRYSVDRRAIRLVSDGSAKVEIRLTSEEPCVNPVIELDNLPGKLVSLMLNSRPIPPEKFACDGRVLWLDGSFVQPMKIALQFDDSGGSHD